MMRSAVSGENFSSTISRNSVNTMPFMAGSSRGASRYFFTAPAMRREHGSVFQSLTPQAVLQPTMVNPRPPCRQSKQGYGYRDIGKIELHGQARRARKFVSWQSPS